MSETHSDGAPSPWVTRFAPLFAQRGRVLDLACGSGRNAKWLASTFGADLRVVAADRDAQALSSLAEISNIETRCVDLEGETWPFANDNLFDGIVVTNYLWRPRFDDVMSMLKSDGVLIYETFAAGNEAFGKPSRSDFLLQPNELLARVRNRLQIVAFEQGFVGVPKPAVVQRICAVGAARGWPNALPLTR